MLRFVPLACLLASACTGGTVLRTGDACGVAGAQSVLGANRAAAQGFADQRNGAGMPTRLAGPTDAVTADINPARLTLILDGDGTVRDLACG